MTHLLNDQLFQRLDWWQRHWLGLLNARVANAYVDEIVIETNAIIAMSLVVPFLM